MLLILCAVIAYFPAIHAGFIWDDDLLLTANRQMESIHGLKEIWLGNSSDYTPLTITTFWLEHALWGNTPIGYHIVNILLHAFAGILVWRILSILQVRGSWLAALLFVIHPVNVASVAWIAELKNTLSGALFFGSILAFLIAGKRSSTKFYCFSVALFGLAGLSKGAVVGLPLVLCGCIIWMNRKITGRDLLRVAPFALMALAIAFLTIRFQSRAFDYGLVSSAPPFRFARACAVVWLYLREIVWPIRLSPMFPQWQPNLRSAVVYLPALLAGATLGCFWWKRKSWGRPLLFASGYYLWMLLPVLGFVWMALQQETPCADWWQYLAAPGIFAAIAGGFTFASISAAKKSRGYLHTLAVVILALLVVQTWRRCAIYESMETYCRAVLAENPHAWTLQTNLGAVLKQRGEFEQAIACHRRALLDNPRFMEAHNNLGNALSAAGRYPEAETEFRAALKLSPSNPIILGNLGDNYFCQGKISEALVADAEAIKADRYNPGRHLKLGIKFAASQQFEKAIACFRNALILNPSDVDTRKNLVQTLVAAGHPGDAAVVSEGAAQAAVR